MGSRRKLLDQQILRVNFYVNFDNFESTEASPDFKNINFRTSVDVDLHFVFK